MSASTTCTAPALIRPSTSRNAPWHPLPGRKPWLVGRNSRSKIGALPFLPPPLRPAVLAPRNAERAARAVCFGYLHAPHRLRSIAFVFEVFVQFVEVRLGLCVESFHCDPIHTRRTPLAPHPFPPRCQGRFRIHLVDQAVPFASWDAVVQRRQHPLVPYRGFHPVPLRVPGFFLLFSCFHH